MDSDMPVDPAVLEHHLRALDGGGLVALSGGVDSGLLAYVAARVLPGRMLAVTGDSPSLARSERAAVEAFCASHAIPHEFVATQEFTNPHYLKNPNNRCYFCKQELFARLDAVRQARDYCWILEGTNADDVQGHRPGHKAGQEQPTVQSPYVDLGMTKSDVRAIAASYGLALADKPASPCLASRIPTGRPIRVEELARVEAAERILRQHGLVHHRVRCHGDLARIECPAHEEMLIMRDRTAILLALQDIGFCYITIDLAGYRPAGEGARAATHG